MKLSGKITFTRSQGAAGSSMRLEVVDSGSGIAFLGGEMSMEDFAMMVTGHGHMPISLETRGLDKLGLLAEHKTENIAFERGRKESECEEAARAAIAPFEVDGWTGDWKAFFNFHNRVGTATTPFRVAFHRWVPHPEGGKEEAPCQPR